MSPAPKEKPRLTIMLVPDRGEETHTYRVSYGRLRILGGLAAVAAIALTLVAGSWWYLAARAARVSDLEREVAELRAERDQVLALGQQLEILEQQYGRIRSLFGMEPGAPSEVWLPPLAGRPSRSADRNTAETSLPNSWPLTERGFVTQGLLDTEEDEANHPGLDIAIPTDSYVRAAGAGTVVEAGEGPVYGRFVVIDHGGGYTSLYAHASLHLVVEGQVVRRNEVIALSGSTGRSTAPHLHFEILLNGEAVDPLTMVEQP
jgi:murein DD-endopeptidase MepM/ murein hydrolase activator NlpD